MALSVAQDLTGIRFGRLVVISRAENTRKQKSQWHCRCDCGTMSVIRGEQLRGGITRSCGCLHKEVFRRIVTKHGLSQLPEYEIYYAMRARCLNPNGENFHNYGGRGIKICQRWMEFPAFYADVGTRPSPDHSIDRVDNNGHYSCGKCPDCQEHGWAKNWRWATQQEQCQNTRKNRPILVNGRLMSRRHISEQYGIPYFTLCDRIRRRLPLEMILSPHHLPRGGAALKHQNPMGRTPSSDLSWEPLPLP